MDGCDGAGGPAPGMDFPQEPATLNLAKFHGPCQCSRLEAFLNGPAQGGREFLLFRP